MHLVHLFEIPEFSTGQLHFFAMPVGKQLHPEDETSEHAKLDRNSISGVGFWDMLRSTRDQHGSFSIGT